ncbi:hypothetical protein KIN20_027087 [Parelaphostrongylus tenuis]|uniref:Uncharacterized protein n=1 Tax=Parelaphostrongylus tenuis TaxID=148309 RepID=A0AAD5WDP3_PARTN|nr:hypothetical protein KIN20_027087 [Parelaphostrongylus tenuis]
MVSVMKRSPFHRCFDEAYGRKASAFKTNAKSRGIRGQAFGVGAFEDEDENIYSNYDLNQFDFALDAPGTSEQGRSGVDCTFVMSNKRLNPRKFYAPPKLPPNFRPTHRPKPLDSARLPSALQDAMKTLTAIQRAKLLGENRVSVMEMVSDKDRKRLEQHRSRWDQRQRDDGEERKSKDRIEFPDEPLKQARFKEYLKYLRRGLVLPQPKELSVWEWESEKKEFEGKLTAEERGMLPEVRARALPLAKSALAMPIQELLQSRFAKETGLSGHAEKHDSDKMAAVKMQMFGEKTRTTFDWYPHNVLAKRFNIPNPFPDGGIVGVPHLQKSTKKETLLNLGLPQTANELSHRRVREVKRNEEKEEPEKQQKVKEDDLDRPPGSIFDVIFGESDSESDTDDDDELAESKAEAVEAKKEVMEESTEKSTVTKVEEEPKKTITVMDIVSDDVDFGPPPPPSTSETTIGFSVLNYLKEELDRRKEEKREKIRRKHKEEKSKKERSSKKSRKEKKKKKRKKKSRRHSSSSSSSSSVIEITD